MFYSNGPGDPAASGDHVELLRGVLDEGLPFFGICFGNQLLGRALGFGTYKLPFGHRGINQPVLDKPTGRVEITAHNHGFAVDAPLEGVDSPNGYGRVEVSHVGLNDNVVEGLRALDIPAFSVQYHPEAAAGPHDANYLFDRFAELVVSTPEGQELMPKREDIHSVLVIGSGPIVIGQAAEFDYSGTQACRVLREEGVRVILVNPNPATIMTDPDFADATYIEPITWQVIETIIAKEKPDAILPTLGGQTALNAAIALHNNGILEKYDVELIGANFEAINKGEDRQIFKQLVLDAGADVAASRIAHTMDECLAAADELGYPLVVRPSFTMGGLGSGFAYDERDLRRIAGAGLHDSPTREVLLEESILGWKEYELELMRDTADNTVVVCSIENVDPVGVHTGDSITVAPALTLTDREYQNLRDIGIDIIRAVGVDTGGCNIQFAVNPADGRVIVIEMNPRVSRSSALASKATGFPIAKIAAKLAIGYRLDEIPNDITKVTPASFEPTLDYVVVKVPRFDFEKFPAADTTLTTTMKSVGEAMAIGRNYATALQKALRSLEKRGSSFHWGDEPRSVDELLEMSKIPTDGRIITVQQALRQGATIEQLFDATGIDPWFLDQIVLINEVAEFVAVAAELDADTLRVAKEHGFSDAQIAQLRGTAETEMRGIRHGFGVRPVYKTVDTCAGEFPALTPYHYSSYDFETEVEPSDRRKVVIIGSGPNRIGQGVEFDYSCVHASFALSDGRVRDRDGQLQPRDGLDRLRHQRPAVLRAADAGGRPRGAARRGPVGRDLRRHLPARRPDTAGPREGHRGRRLPHPRHEPRGDRPRRGAAAVQRHPGCRRPHRPAPRHGDRRSRRGRGRRGHRLPRPRAPELRARRPGHGDRLRHREPARLLRPHGRRGDRRPGNAAAGRPLPRRRHRDSTSTRSTTGTSSTSAA